MAISCDAFLESFSTEVPRPRLLKALEQLLQLRIRILGVLYHMSNRPLITINLPIIPARIRLIAKEVNLIIHHATPALLVRNMLETVRLVPARGEHVKGDLSADGVCEAEVGEGFFERGDHGGADVVLNVVGLVVVALLDRGVAADGGDVDHAIAEFDEGAALDGDVEVGDVVEDPGEELLVLSVYTSWGWGES
jgi:hypothetical protein